MITRILPWIGAVAVASSGALAQSPPSSSTWRPTPSAFTPRAFGAGSGVTLGHDAGLRAPQGPDYTNEGFFRDAYGDFMDKRQRWQPTARGSFLLQPKQAIDSEGGDFDLLMENAYVEKQIVIAHHGYLIAGAEFHRRNYLSDVRVRRGIATGAVGDQDLYGIGLILGGGLFIQDDLLVEAALRPSIRSDFDGTLHGGDDYRMFFRSRIEWRVQDDLFLKAGLDYDETYRDVNLLPVIGVSWMPVPDWRVDVLLPKYAEVTWELDPAVLFNFGIDVMGDEYHVRSSAATQKIRSDIQVQEIRVGVGAQFRFNDQLSVFGRFGVNVAGDYKFGDADDLDIADGTLEPALFFQAGIGFDF